MDFKKITEELKKQRGHVGMYYKNLVTGDEFGYKEDESFLAASVIKLPILMVLSKLDGEKTLSMKDRIEVRDEDKLPICGALTLFTGKVDCDIKTLSNLMISISDNTATNLIIDYIGLNRLKEEFKKLGLGGTEINRKLFDEEAGKRGLENYIVPKEIGGLLEKIYLREFFSKKVSEDIEEILLLQQINHKMCGRIGEKYKVAHKTGEDDDLTNDVGIVYTKNPFIVCFAGHDTCVPDFEDFIRKTTEILCIENDK